LKKKKISKSQSKHTLNLLRFIIFFVIVDIHKDALQLLKAFISKHHQFNDFCELLFVLDKIEE